MSRRIDIELTSALEDGTWTWRAAGAKQPKGVLDGGILPSGAKVGDELKVEIDQQLDGVTVLSVVQGRQKQDRNDVLELLSSDQDFQPVIETRAKRERGERRGRDDGRRPRRDRDDRPDGGRGRRGRRDDRGDRGDRGEGGGRRGDGRGPRGDGRGRRGPSFTPPPEVPQRPKPKRLRPGKSNRNAVLNDLPAEQRPIAELALQGLPAVRQRLREENERAVAEGRATMPEASVLKIAEELLPRLRVAEWRDRAEAAQQQIDDLDLRDLRSVVAAANDPMVARDDTTRPLVEELQAALVTKQEQELHLWFGDVDAALAVGRVVRALRLSSQPPKAGVPFPADIAQRLVDSTNASLAPMDSPERWIAMLEAAAFSPVRTMVRPARKPDAVNDELMATVKRLAPALPKVAELFEIEVDPNAPMPKPQRPGPRNRRGDAKGKDGGKRARPAKRAAKSAAPPAAVTSERDAAPDPTPEPAPEPAATASTTATTDTADEATDNASTPATTTATDTADEATDNLSTPASPTATTDTADEATDNLSTPASTTATTDTADEATDTASTPATIDTADEATDNASDAADTATATANEAAVTDAASEAPVTDATPGTSDPAADADTAPDTSDPAPDTDTAPDTSDPAPDTDTAPDTSDPAPYTDAVLADSDADAAPADTAAAPPTDGDTEAADADDEPRASD